MSDVFLISQQLFEHTAVSDSSIYTSFNLRIQQIDCKPVQYLKYSNSDRLLFWRRLPYKNTKFSDLF